jgi:hypothetical protein
MRRFRVAAVALGGAAVVIAGTIAGEAHKPITSPFTYNEDVFPILRARCGACHVAGGVAPMSLMTAADATPWAESMRQELIAGHMPPMIADNAPGLFRDDNRLTGRELNMLLTWATGGTPAGDPARAPAPVTLDTSWPLGPPDLELPLSIITLDEQTQDRTVSIVRATGLTESRPIRAVDLRPGTPAIVRSADISVAAPSSRGATGAPSPERRLALWQPGGAATAAASGTAFELPAGSSLAVTIRYKKTWQYERRTMIDRSTLGIYFAPDSPARIDALPVDSTTTLDRDTRIVALYPDPTLSQVHVAVDATRPDGSRDRLFSGYPQRAWARRFWYARPVTLPRGTRIDVTIEPYDEAALLPPGAAPAPAATAVAPIRRVVLNVVRP